jgi:endoglucanase
MEKEKTELSFLVYGTFVFVIALAVAFFLNIGNIRTARPPEFSKRNMLQALWYQYKNNYLEKDTLRSLDKQRGNISTSEGQSYSLLRAVWMDDKDTFDAVWQWTKDNMQRDEDHLLSWLFGQRKDGTYGVLTDQGGYNTATDADQDVALALLFAWKRWNDEKYFGDAILIVRDIWSKEVLTIGGKPYLMANNTEKTLPKATAIINPSYFAPYAYKIFADVDPSHNWLGLASTSYDVIDKSLRVSVNNGSSNSLPPDWLMIDKKTGELSPAPESMGLKTDFSFDAMRVPWRVALDYQWTKDPRAKTLLDKMSFLANEWRSKKVIAASYSHDGKEIIEGESPAVYGGVLGYFTVANEREAAAIYRRKLEALYDPNESKWHTPQSYYDENWAWFGMALFAGELRNLYERT